MMQPHRISCNVMNLPVPLSLYGETPLLQNFTPFLRYKIIPTDCPWTSKYFDVQYIPLSQQQHGNVLFSRKINITGILIFKNINFIFLLTLIASQLHFGSTHYSHGRVVPPAC